MAEFSGLRIEQDRMLPGRAVCVWYEDGRRRAEVFMDTRTSEMRVIHEADVRVRVLKRSGADNLEEMAS